MKKTYLDLSTAHLMRSTMMQLEYQKLTPPQWPAMTIAPYEFGVFISVPDMPNLDQQQWWSLPLDMQRLLNVAYLAGAELVRLDADGHTHPDLVTYDR